MGLSLFAIAAVHQGLAREQRGPVDPVNPACRRFIPPRPGLCARSDGIWAFAERRGIQSGRGDHSGISAPTGVCSTRAENDIRNLESRFSARSRIAPPTPPHHDELAPRRQGCRRGSWTLAQPGSFLVDGICTLTLQQKLSPIGRASTLPTGTAKC